MRLSHRDIARESDTSGSQTWTSEEKIDEKGNDFMEPPFAGARWDGPALGFERQGTGPLRVTEAAGKCALSSTITVKVNDLSQLLKNAGNDYSKILLYLDGYPIKGIVARSVGGTSNQLLFDLRRTPESKQSWNNLLGMPKLLPPSPRPVSVTVGLDNQPIDTDVKTYDLFVVDESRLWTYLAILALSLILFWWLAWSSDIIRDSGPQPQGSNPQGKPNRKVYSLGRFQMAVWFFLVVASYVFIWMVTGAYDTLASSVLALIGISAGTALAGTIVDYNKRNDADSQLRARQIEKANLETEIGSLNSALTATPAPSNLDALKRELADKTTRLNQAAKAVEQLTSAITPLPSESFLTDILSDANGISFHRFQIAAWTLVLGIIFIASVCRVLTMPDFPESLLGLMGISSGTYLGFKFPEQR